MAATFLIRYLEAGRDAQRGGQRRDLAATTVERVPGAVVTAETGRLVVEVADEDAARAREVLADLSGIASLSPCTRCDVDGVEAEILARARAIPVGAAFRVSVRQRSTAGEASPVRAARLGARVLAARPDLRVDLHAPDAVLGVEIRGGDAFVYDEVIAGRDWREAAPTAPTAAEPRFVADQMLGRLATWLRLLGYDTVHPWDQPDSWVLRVARDEGRIVLTRDGPMAQVRSTPVHFVRARHAVDQLAEVVRAFGLAIDDARLFTRCARCNQLVEPVDRDAVIDRLPPAIAADRALALRRCPRCDQIYWRGAHVDRILEHLRAIA